MEFRIKKRIGAVLILGLTTGAWAEPVTFTVRHEHLREGRTGTLEISTNSISFREDEKKPKHSREWKYEDIQQITLSLTELRILTYEDQKWKFGLDREYLFDRLPKGFASQVYPLFRSWLDQRFVADLADPDVKPLWKIGAKLRQGLGGSVGVILVGEDRIVYDTENGEPRTWRYRDIDNISSSGPFDLSITTFERSAWHHGSPTEYHFQLKEELREDRYNELWRRINHTKGLQIISADSSVKERDND
jgi:hypothetical protein